MLRKGMGCYGHNRARQLIVGRVSRRIFDSMTIPVLRAH
jgi:nucleotide-binding universal stress UspA family protein